MVEGVVIGRVSEEEKRETFSKFHDPNRLIRQIARARKLNMTHSKTPMREALDQGYLIEVMLLPAGRTHLLWRKKGWHVETLPLFYHDKSRVRAWRIVE